MTAGALSVLMATPAYAASAANPRVMDLPGCTDGATTQAGGWVDRQVSFQGTDDPDFVGQIRPRTVRLGELCVDGSHLGIPFTATDTNPADETYSPGVGGGWQRVCGNGSSAPTNRCMQWYATVPAASTSGWGDLECFHFTDDTGAEFSGTYNPGIYATWDHGTAFDGSSSSSQADYGFAPWAACRAQWTDGGTPRVGFLVIPGGDPNPLTGYAVGGSSSHGPVAMEDGGLGPTIGATYGSPFILGGADDGSAVAECSTSAGGAVTDTVELETNDYFEQDWVPVFDPGDTDFSNPIWSRSYAIVTDADIDDCPYIVSITVDLYYWDLEQNPICTLMTWTGTRYNNQVPYTDKEPKDDVCSIYPAWQGCTIDSIPEIVCEIEYTDPGNPITVIGEFFGGLGPWIACMVMPVGWDREGLIDKTWNNGNISELADAYNAAVPNGIACGDVASFSMPWGTVSIDTCDMDVAPSWVKTAVGGLIILAIAAIAVKRIMWAVGSKG